MPDLRRTLLFLYIVCILPAPCLFTFLLLKYHQDSFLLLYLMIGNFISALTLFVAIFLLKKDKNRFWIYVIFVLVTVASTLAILWTTYDILERIAYNFDVYRKIFQEAIEKQIQFQTEPSEVVWALILLKQCCGTISDQIDQSSKEYQLFMQSPFNIFCTRIPVERKTIEMFEKKTKMTYSPRGPCLRVIFTELKFELISASFITGLDVFTLLFTWLFLYQNWNKYWNLMKLKSKNKKKKKKSLPRQSKKSSSVVSTTPEPAVTEYSPPSQLRMPDLVDKSMPIVIKTVENKRTFKGFVVSSEDFQ